MRRPRGHRFRARPLLGLVFIAGCQFFPDHHLMHPRQVPTGVVTWAEDVRKGPLLIHVRGARPDRSGPFPTVVVHPEGGKTAADMVGVLWDLAGRGYCAIGADYERLIDGAYGRSLFAWRSPADVQVVVELAHQYPAVDRARISALGFSQGGVFSLLIAAYAGDQIKAVVSYYPVTDFPHWLRDDRPGWWERRKYDIIRWYFRRESDARDDAEFVRLLRGASPYYVADAIRAPVLLIHGARDTTAPPEESVRMAERLVELGKVVQLFIVPDGVHIFNFRQREQAAAAWDLTIQWLDRYLTSAAPDRALWSINGRASPAKEDSP